MQYVVHVMETTPIRKAVKAGAVSEEQSRTFKIGALECENADMARSFADRNTFGPYSAIILCRIYTGNRSVLLTQDDMRAVAEEYRNEFER